MLSHFVRQFQSCRHFVDRDRVGNQQTEKSCRQRQGLIEKLFPLHQPVQPVVRIAAKFGKKRREDAMFDHEADGRVRTFK